MLVHVQAHSLLCRFVAIAKNLLYALSGLDFLLVLVVDVFFNGLFCGCRKESLHTLLAFLVHGLFVDFELGFRFNFSASISVTLLLSFCAVSHRCWLAGCWL